MWRGGQAEEITDKISQLKEMSIMEFLKGLFAKEPDKPIIDKKIVEKALKDALWPLLKQHGFDTFKGRTAWRHQGKKIDVVEIQFFPKEQVGKWNITPYSFALGAGVFFTFIPPHAGPIKNKGGELLPKEVDCHLRTTPFKTLKQRECKIPNIWYIDPLGKYLESAIGDARKHLEDRELLWFGRFNNLGEVLRMLLEVEPSDEIHGMGAKLSPKRSYITGFVALEFGRWHLAVQSLQEALDSNCFSTKPGVAWPGDDRIRETIAKAKSAMGNMVKREG